MLLVLFCVSLVSSVTFSKCFFFFHLLHVILFINEIILGQIIVKSGLIEDLSCFDALLNAIRDAKSNK